MRNFWLYLARFCLRRTGLSDYDIWVMLKDE